MISALSLLGVMVKAGMVRVCKQVLLVNKWLICGIDQMTESLKPRLMLLTRSFLEGSPPLGTINMKKFLREQLAPFVSQSQSPVSYLSGSVEVHSFLKLLLYLFQE